MLNAIAIVVAIVVALGAAFVAGTIYGRGLEARAKAAAGQVLGKL